MHTSTVVVFAMLVVSVWSMPSGETYDTKFDNIDVDKLLQNDRIVSQYVKCFLDKGPCTAEGREFKQNLPEALATDCKKCSPAQKNLIRKASSHIITKRPADWTLIQKKYDPTGERKTAFEAFLRRSD